MLLAREVLDKQVVDRDGHKVGKVDNIVLELREGERPVVVAIVGGHGALASELGGTAERIGAWLRRFLLGEEGTKPPSRVGWEHVTQIDVVVHLDTERSESGYMSTEDAIWKRWLRGIPWAER
jgi:sporulation protein YlmC with PRC-barrel domain